MPKSAPIQTNFNTGELSPLMYGRVDFDKYKSALAVCLNHVPLVQGGVTRRPGTVYVAPTKDSSQVSILVRFVFSTTQSYVLEFGNQYVRVYRTHAQVVDGGGTPIEFATPYTTADLFVLNFTQSADTLYVAHNNYAPRKITRTSDTAWSIATISFRDGPYFDQNPTSQTLTFSAATGSAVTCTASAATVIGAANNGAGLIRIEATGHGFIATDTVIGTGVGGTTEANGTWSIVPVDADHFDLVGSAFVHAWTSGGSFVTNAINAGAGFAAGDVGRVVRAQQSSTGAWGWATIAAVADALHCTVNIVQTMSGTSATALWRLGLWSTTTGWPACVTFYQDRLCYGGSTSMPETINCSVTGDYENHAPTAYDSTGLVADDNAMSFTLDSNDVQIVRWLSGDANGLLVGTVAGEWAVTPSSLGEALTPTNINAKQMTAYGEAQIQPLRVGYTTLGLQRSLRKLREFTFVYYENRYHAPDMTVLSQHITYGGITQMAYQQEPNSVVWMTRADGTLVGFTYERDQNVLGWHRHTLGGVSDANGAPAVVESVATITAPDGTRDEVWMIVKRFINGATVRTVEYMTKLWERGDAQASAVYFDASLTYSGAPATAISGFTHLIGETLGVLADGSVHPNVVVDGTGTITLQRAASIVTAGYAYNSDGQDLRGDSGAGDGTAQGKTHRTNRLAVRLHDSLGIQLGPDFDHLVPRIERTLGDALGTAVPLFSGDDTDTWEGDYTFDDNVCWRFNTGLPGTVLAIMPQQMTFDR